MQILDVRPQGFCGGVNNALKKVLDLKKQRPDAKITVLGSLVHNRFVSRQLMENGIRCTADDGRSRLELLDDIDDGIVVFSAHGVSDAVRKKAAEKGLELFDASCPFVLSTQKLIEQKLQEGYTVFYIGKKGHPEAEASLNGHSRVILLQSESDIPDDIKEPVFVTNQTTMSVMEIRSLFDEIRRRYPGAQFHDEICSATRVRQQALMNLKEQNPDALIVVGDPSSNNTRKLADTGRQAGIPLVIETESLASLDLSVLKDVQLCAVTSGASTPGWLKDEIIEALQKLDL